ncbi:MAG: polyhydroxyalkanoic acid synthase [Rhodobacteraceae bacterium]|nr:polyhydroxyalkanoic acid synthase [Paracoccaceae bacterium]
MDTPKRKTRKAGKRTRAKAGHNLPIPVDVPRVQPAANSSTKADQHPYQYIDRIARAVTARYTGGLSPFSTMLAWSDWALHLSRAPGRQLELSELAFRNMLTILTDTAKSATDEGVKPPFHPGRNDHRFTYPNWSKMPFRYWQQSFLAAQDWWDHATDDLRGLSDPDSARVSFMIRQMLDLYSPSNFPVTNPEILEATLRRGGANLTDGARHFSEDLIQTWLQKPAKPLENFKVGEDIACTPGKVVFQNDIFELIQYAPTTAKVKAEPVLIVPAWIMKYYILDLSPHNSLIRYLVQEGHTVFAISWCNPTADQSGLSLDDYRLRGVMAALDAISAIVPDQKIHATGYCLGGTILSITACTMARDGDERLASLTLLAAQIDFTEAGELLLFLDDSQVAFLEDMMWAQGYLDRPQMAQTFASMRSEDLIYARAVRRYFLGVDDLPTDLTVWSKDTTRMPAAMHGEYLRALFLENRLTAGRFAVDGRVVALKDIDVPIFVVGTEDDHIAPWRSVYKMRLFTDSEFTFALTSSGHNGGILSEPGHPRRHYRIGERRVGENYVDPDTWYRNHAPVEGSWWTAWADWLDRKSTGRIKPPTMGLSGTRYAPISEAPGYYIMQK